MSQQYGDEPESPASPSPEGPALDVNARLAQLTRSSQSTSIFGRRVATPDAPDAAPHAAVPSPSSPNATAQTDPPSASEPPAASAPSPAAVTPTPRRVGRLSRLVAREIWPDDAALAGWLADDPSLLGEAIDTTLITAATGPLPNRVVATAADGTIVSVVVEVGRTTDAGLSALVGIASMGGAETVVWLTGDADPTHGASLSWLNRSADADFYLVRIGGARIGPSDPAALLEVVVRPPRAEDAGDSSGAPTPEVPAARRVEDHDPEG